MNPTNSLTDRWAVLFEQAFLNASRQARSSQISLIGSVEIHATCIGILFVTDYVDAFGFVVLAADRAVSRNVSHIFYL